MDVPSEILNRYIERRKLDLEICRESLKSGNFTLLEKVGHQLKGNGVTFGHPELSLIGEKLELAAALKKANEVKDVLSEFSGWVNTSSIN